MEYSLQHRSDPSEWMYSQHDISLPSNTQEPLSEPVPFEDFQFSFGLDPGFSAPVPFDIPTDPPTLNDSSHLLSMDYQHDVDQPHQSADIALADNNPLLDENDQKAFSQFLDAFFVDKDGQISNAEQMASEFSTMYDAQPPPLLLNDTYDHSTPPTRTSGLDPYQVATSMFLPKPSAAARQQQARRNQEDEDEYRRTSILQSLDQQKQFHQRLNRVASAQQLVTKEPAATTVPSSTTRYQDPIGPNAIFLQQSNQVSAPFIAKHLSSTSQRYHPQQHAPYPPPERHYHRPSSASTLSSSSSSSNHRQNSDHDQESHHHRTSSSRSLSTSTRRNKSHKELLTEEEKRSNHIASEQKRRSTIRNGFKDLTDIVPTLKNINNSKSTVLFKAVDFIKYLEKRNNHLRDKMKSLEVRVKVEGRVSDMLMHASPSTTLQPIMVPSHSSHHHHSNPDMSLSSSRTATAIEDDKGWTRSSYHHQNDDNSNSHSTGEDNNNNNKNNSGSSGGGVAAALLAHKSQQQQLMALQEQLQYHQRLLAQQDEEPQQQQQQQQHPQQQNPQRYNSMSSSSASSSAHSSPQSSDLYQHPSHWAYDSNSNHHSTKDSAAVPMHPHVRMDVDNEEPLKVSA